MKSASYLFSSYFGLAVCFSFVSCNKITDTQVRRDAAKLKLEQLTQENADLSGKIATLKQAMPNIVSEALALQLVQKSSKDLLLLEEQLTTTIKGYQETELALQTMEKDIEAFRTQSGH